MKCGYFSTFDFMNKTWYLFLFYLVLIPKLALASGGAGILKGAAHSAETKVLTTPLRESSSVLLRNSEEFIRHSRIPTTNALRLNKALQIPLLENLKQFKLKRIGELVDFGFDIAEKWINPESDYRLNTGRSEYIQEIIHSPIYSQFYKAMCKQFNADTLTPSVQYLALNGAKINGIRISNDSLYNIYLICSETFALDELIQLRKSVGCDEHKLHEIDNYARGMGIELPDSNCPEKEEEGDWLDALIGFVAIGLILYAMYKTLIWLGTLIKKIRAYFKRD